MSRPSAAAHGIADTTVRLPTCGPCGLDTRLLRRGQLLGLAVARSSATASPQWHLVAARQRVVRRSLPARSAVFHTVVALGWHEAPVFLLRPAAGACRGEHLLLAAACRAPARARDGTPCTPARRAATLFRSRDAAARDVRMHVGGNTNVRPSVRRSTSVVTRTWPCRACRTRGSCHSDPIRTGPCSRAAARQGSRRSASRPRRGTPGNRRSDPAEAAAEREVGIGAPERPGVALVARRRIPSRSLA
jgi:hypothetical protein